MQQRLYRPGQLVPESGIYRVVHENSHTPEHEVTSVRGEHFPPCRVCGQGVRYELVRSAKHLRDEDRLEQGRAA